MDELGLAGSGTIEDWSLGGAKIRLNRNLDIPIGARVSIESKKIPMFPRISRVRWVHRVGTTTHCGVAFQMRLAGWEKWVAENASASDSRP